ncbi:MAG: HPr(Ser) kinase/phosphatase [Oscillospiraceae bacterium]|nr:HPr(Ser) kinase/phosphatase [Oscillospiraceae bacterium]
MPAQYSVPLAKLIKDHGFEVLNMPRRSSETYIVSKDVNRPGLILAGYEEHFDPQRAQFLGLTENGYLESLAPGEREKRLQCFLSKKPTVLLLTRSIEPVPELLPFAEEYGVPVLRTAEETSNIMSVIISYLGVELAERITRHGVLVEVYGEGMLILGNSGVGKSETAVELIKRGHRLVADDAVEIRRVSSKTLVGSAPDNIRHFIELRGIGIINARRIFGMGSVKMTEKIDMVILIEQWDDKKVYDRMGLDDEFVDILGIKVPAAVVPVKPGRNLAIIIESAAMNNRQRKMGYNAAQELMKSLGMAEGAVEEELDFSDMGY